MTDALKYSVFSSQFNQNRTFLSFPSRIILALLHSQFVQHPRIAQHQHASGAVWYLQAGIKTELRH